MGTAKARVRAACLGPVGRQVGLAPGCSWHLLEGALQAVLHLG